MSNENDQKDLESPDVSSTFFKVTSIAVLAIVGSCAIGEHYFNPVKEGDVTGKIVGGIIAAKVTEEANRREPPAEAHNNIGAIVGSIIGAHIVDKVNKQREARRQFYMQHPQP